MVIISIIISVISIVLVYSYTVQNVLNVSRFKDVINTVPI